MKIRFYMRILQSRQSNALPVVARKIDIDECTMHVFVSSWHRFDDKDVIVSQFHLLIKLSQVIVITTSLKIMKSFSERTQSLTRLLKVCLIITCLKYELMNWPDTDLLMESSSRSLDTLRDMTILTSLLCCFDLTKCFPLTNFWLLRVKTKMGVYVFVSEIIQTTEISNVARTLCNVDSW